MTGQQQNSVQATSCVITTNQRQDPDFGARICRNHVHSVLASRVAEIQLSLAKQRSRSSQTPSQQRVSSYRQRFVIIVCKKDIGSLHFYLVLVAHNNLHLQPLPRQPESPMTNLRTRRSRSLPLSVRRAVERYPHASELAEHDDLCCSVLIDHVRETILTLWILLC